jgi:hypothetical protein
MCVKSAATVIAKQDTTSLAMGKETARMLEVCIAAEDVFGHELWQRGSKLLERQCREALNVWLEELDAKAPRTAHTAADALMSLVGADIDATRRGIERTKEELELTRSRSLFELSQSCNLGESLLELLVDEQETLLELLCQLQEVLDGEGIFEARAELVADGINAVVAVAALCKGRGDR